MKLPGDLQRFKSLTMGHTLLMGRKTCESIGRLLPGRTTLVLTRNPHWCWEGAEVAHSWEAAVERWRSANRHDELFVVGGEEIYRQGLPFASRIHATEVDIDVEGDAFFPR